MTAALPGGTWGASALPVASEPPAPDDRRGSSARSDLADFRARVRTFVKERLIPRVEAWEAMNGIPRALFEELGRAELLGLTARPRGAGGEGVGQAAILMQELAEARAAGIGASVLSHAAVCVPLVAAHGSASQQEEFLGPLLAGTRVAGIAATEPGAGSDFGGLACQACDRGDDWELTGEKKFITNAPIADLLLVLARREGASGLHAFTLLLLPTDAPGCEVLPRLRPFGLRSSPLGWVRFTRCRVPKRLTLGDPRGGFLYAARQLMTERLLASVGVLALGRLALEDTVAYLRARPAYGRTLAALQTVRHALVDHAADLEALRRMADGLCASAARGQLEERAICMLKIRSSELLQRITGLCLELHGAAGFLEEHWLARAYRDARAASLAGGSNGMLRDLVAAYMRL